LLGTAAQGRAGGEFQRGGFHVRSLSVCACLAEADPSAARFQCKLWASPRRVWDQEP
jgi:hypothetical protein